MTNSSQEKILLGRVKGQLGSGDRVSSTDIKALLTMIETPAGKSLAIELIEKECARLTEHVQQLLECNNDYLQRARDAERALKELRR